MKSLDVAWIGDVLSDHVRHGDQEPLILTDQGRPVAAVIPLRGMDRETLSLSINPRFQAILERARTRRATEGGLTHEELLRQLSDEGDASGQSSP